MSGDLDEAAARARCESLAEWVYDRDKDLGSIWTTDGHRAVTAWLTHGDDAAWIFAARTDLPAALDRIAELRRELLAAKLEPHGKEGCRVGDRLDILIAERDAAREHAEDMEILMAVMAANLYRMPLWGMELLREYAEANATGKARIRAKYRGKR